MSRAELSRPRPERRVTGRGLRLLAAALAVALLALAVTSSVREARRHAAERLDHTLTARSGTEAHALTAALERAHGLTVLLARDPALLPLASPRVSPDDRAAAVAGLAAAARLHPAEVAETAVLDLDGEVLLRVGPETLPATLADPVGAATELTPGRIRQEAVEPGGTEPGWRLATMTPLAGPEGTWGVLRVVTAPPGPPASVQATGPDGAGVRVLDTATGRVVPAGPEATGSNLPPAVLAAVRSGAALVGHEDLRTAVAPVHGSPGEGVDGSVHGADWAVLVTAPAAGPVAGGLGTGPTALVAAAALLVLVSVGGALAGRRGLREAALTDDLTGLPNRRLLVDRLEQALLLSRRRHTRCAVMLIDLDRFREVNDTLGHPYGDELLRGVADRLRGALRASDSVARLGGDEFAVLLPEVADEPAARALAARCLAALQGTFLVQDVAVNVEASLGLALAPEHGESAHDLLRAADVAMYDAKVRRCGTVVYDAGSDTNTPVRLALLGDLRRALDGDELTMHFQPKLDLDTDAMRSVEALVRWQHPTRGPVAPVDFVPVAEGTGLMMPLTLHTLDLAVGQGRRWLDAGRPLQVAVNLSPRCLLDADFPSAVARLLTRHGLPSHLLRLEVTESTFMADPSRALAVLATLRGLGLALSIDDFGTGFSSMSYLKQLPADELKIDRTFVTHMLRTSHDDVLVRSSIDLAHNLGMSVVAEGVEDQATVETLRSLGCDVVQGYHVGRPMPAADLDGWLARRGHPRGLHAV